MTNRLRHLDDGGEIELLDRRLDGRFWRRWRLLRDARVALVELGDLGQRSPAGVATAGLRKVDVRQLFETAKVVELGGQLAGERLVLEEAALRGGADRLVKETHRLHVVAFEARPFRRDQGMLMRERRRAALGPPCK